MPLPRRRLRRIRSALGASLAGGALVAAALVAAVFTGSAPAAAASTPPRGDVIANLFEWNWNSVATECSTVLGPNGYGGVQVAPPQESVTLASSGHPWWEVYQPVSYQVSSRMGNRAAFAAMVSTCHNAGVKVYADAVLNHMTGQNSAGSGYAGTTF
ncbi:MAG: alpha-amylase, partial [Pseudonocardiales bacterium]|nr:alpha-amylase [Pseudonocardiales bacterium]